ncbi:MAG: hypothetical protein ABEN55_11510, partial [Bradymonadaceae bacterium]
MGPSADLKAASLGEATLTLNCDRVERSIRFDVDLLPREARSKRSFKLRLNGDSAMTAPNSKQVVKWNNLRQEPGFSAKKGGEPKLATTGDWTYVHFDGDAQIGDALTHDSQLPFNGTENADNSRITLFVVAKLEGTASGTNPHDMLVSKCKGNGQFRLEDSVNDPSKSKRVYVRGPGKLKQTVEHTFELGTSATDWTLLTLVLSPQQLKLAR